MRVLLRVLAPLLGLTVAAVGVLVVIEVVAAVVAVPAASGVVVPWADWQATLSVLTWRDQPVPIVAVVVGVVGLLLVLVGLLARRSDVGLDAPGDDLTVTTSGRVLARLVGTRVRAAEDVAAAVVTASARRVSVEVEAWDDATGLRAEVTDRVAALLDELPLRHRPRVVVSVAEREVTA